MAGDPVSLVDLAAAITLLAFWFGMLFFARTLRRLENTVDRMERHSCVVAENLEASIERADKEDSSVPGKSADAALRRAREDD